MQLFLFSKSPVIVLSYFYNLKNKKKIDNEPLELGEVIYMIHSCTTMENRICVGCLKHVL